MKALIFAYHEIGCVGLEATLAAGYDVVGVVTHADAPGEQIWFRSVEQVARSRGIPVHVVDDPNHPSLVEALAATGPDFLFSFYFRKLLKKELLALPSRGALNLHGSLLPRYRGRAPVNWVLVNGETETGVTLHYMDERADHGEIVAQQAVPIDRADTALTLYRKLASAARELLAGALGLLASGTAPRILQDHARATKFPGRKPEDGRISWDWPAERVYNLMRAVTHPWPGAFTTVRGQKLVIWWGDTADREPGGPIGTLVAAGSSLAIQTGQGLFVPDRVQLEGEPEQSWAEFASARALRPGEPLGA
ncbi:MAG: formyltransferase [Candidatus Riflebacteria bacterium]|nr:formyltransferase [Candidatus Riflebacteria bacterium]